MPSTDFAFAMPEIVAALCLFVIGCTILLSVTKDDRG